MVEIQFIDTGTIKQVQYYNAIYGKVKDPDKVVNDLKNNIYHSSDGDYRIIKNLGTPPGKKCRMVTVQFIDTGYTYDVQFGHAIDGQVKDPTRFLYNTKDAIFQSNHYGQYKIIEELQPINGRSMVKIQFINTGSIAEVYKNHALAGQVKDPAFNNINEAASIIGTTSMDLDKIDYYLRPCWNSMKKRCNDSSYSAYANYGAKGVKVCDEWNDYEIFKYDAQNLPGWESKVLDPYNFHLDKDLLQSYMPIENKVYSRNTCVWLPSGLNSQLSINPNIVTICYDWIYAINDIYFIKNPNPNEYSYGPFFDFTHTMRMAFDYYCIYNYNPTTIP